jgi:GH43 family beta-xylosidase
VAKVVRTVFSISRLLLAAAVAVQICPAFAQAPSGSNTFKNPLRPSGADPWVIQWNGFYYYMNTTGANLTIWQTKDMTDLAHARKKVVWTPESGEPYSHELWAPELHRLGNKWYIYFAADAGHNSSHRIFVVENRSVDPLDGSWKFKGKAHIFVPGHNGFFTSPDGKEDWIIYHAYSYPHIPVAEILLTW